MSNNLKESICNIQTDKKITTQHIQEIPPNSQEEKMQALKETNKSESAIHRERKTYEKMPGLMNNERKAN